MNNVDKSLLKNIEDNEFSNSDAINIRKNGKCIERKDTKYINIKSKDNNSGINVYVDDNVKFGIIHIPVIITESGITDTVYNDFYIGKNSNVVIIAGCGIHNDKHKTSTHNGIHKFHLGENSNVTYVEKHYGSGNGDGKKILNPTTEIFMDNNSSMKIDSIQIKGVDDTLRITKAKLNNNTKLTINEKILTHNDQKAITKFLVELNGKNSSAHVTSRSVATKNSYQEFKSNVIGNSKCYAHVECDSILKDNGCVKAIPEIYAKNVDANLIHEAQIGKIAGEQLLKLMSLGMSEKEAEKAIIDGFLN